MRKPLKTRVVITRADGTTEIVRRDGRWWVYNDGRRTTNHLQGVIDQIESEGGTVGREPNPNYERDLHAYEAWKKATSPRNQHQNREIRRIMNQMWGW